MVKKRVRQQVEKLKKLLTQHNFEYQSIILFGSYAQGLESKHSDIDLCIVVDNKKKKKFLNSEVSLMDWSESTALTWILLSLQ